MIDPKEPTFSFFSLQHVRQGVEFYVESVDFELKHDRL
jgi:hypothetical protein